MVSLDVFTYSTSVPTAEAKVKLTVSLSRAAVVALNKIGNKRFEAGAALRQVQQSALIEEAIQVLRKKEGL